MTDPTDRTIRAENGNPLLDADGIPFSEMVLESVDSAEDAEVTVAELAFGQRSWRFGHVIVDEAQDLTPMQWRMIARRARSKSVTIVGDLAQRSIGEPGTWRDHIPDSLQGFAYAELTVNYRAPEEVNRLAASLLGELAPDLRPGKSIRSVGHTPRAQLVSSVSEALPSLVRTESAAMQGGRVAVIAAEHTLSQLGTDDAVALTPWHCKGLEFESVIVVEPSEILAMPHGLSLLYVAVTRTTSRLCFLHQNPMPSVVARALEDQTVP